MTLQEYSEMVKSKMVQLTNQRGFKYYKCTDCNYQNLKTSAVYRN